MPDAPVVPPRPQVYGIPMDLWPLIFEFALPNTTAKGKKRPLYEFVLTTGYTSMNELQVQYVVGGGYPGMKFETPAVAKLLTKYAVHRKMLEQVWEDFHGLMRFFRKMALHRPPLLHTPKEWENLADMQAWILREWMELPNQKDQWVLFDPNPRGFFPRKTPSRDGPPARIKGNM